jgi:hypothetical protein
MQKPTLRIEKATRVPDCTAHAGEKYAHGRPLALFSNITSEISYVSRSQKQALANAL